MNIERMNRVLVVGATGTVGGATVRELLKRGVPVRALVRSERSALKLQSPSFLPNPGKAQAFWEDQSGLLEIVRGDVQDPIAVRAALAGVRSAFYVSPHERNEEQLAETFITACEQQRVRLVFVGVHIPGANRFTRFLKRTLYGFFLPHYRPKFRVAERARTSTADPIVLMPSNFYQNDELFRAQLFEGHYMQPFERPINRVDVRDIGVAAARACTDFTLRSGAYDVSGPESLDAVTCAKIWSEQLGTTVTYPGVNATALDVGLAASMDGKKLADFSQTYVALAKMEAKTQAEEVASTTKLLGRPPIPYVQYVQDTLQTWRETAAAAQ